MTEKKKEVIVEENMNDEDTNKQSYFVLGAIQLNGERVQLLVGEQDHRWYKSKYLGYKQVDPRNRSPKIDVFSSEVEVFTKEDQKYWD